MRPLLLCTAALTVTSAGVAPAAAQERSFWDLLNPDVLMTQVIHTLLLTARTQVKLTYGDLSVSLLDGRIALEGVDMTLPPSVTGGAPCPLRVASVEIDSGDPLILTALRGRLDVRGLEVDAACLPPQGAGPAMAFLPGGVVRVQEMTVEYVYDMPSGAFDVRMASRVDEFAAVSVDAAFDYLWVKGNGPETEVDGLLNRASVTVENLGGWEAFAPILPPAMTDPSQAAAFVTEAVGGVLEAQAEGRPVPKAAKEFLAELATGWAAFVAEPGRLVIESGFPADAPRVIDRQVTNAVAESTLALIDLLELRVGADRAAERDVLDPGLVRRALEESGSVNAAEVREVGLALLTGARAPRNPALAARLLTPLAEAGDGEVALELARATAARNPEAAYAMALAAGTTGAAGLRALLDELERDLPFATILRLQDSAPAPGPADISGPASELRNRAEAHLRGVNAPRSLRLALFYATLAAARGDGAALTLLDRIDRAVPEGDAAQWAAVADGVAAEATQAWLTR